MYVPGFQGRTEQQKKINRQTLDNISLNSTWHFSYKSIYHYTGFLLLVFVKVQEYCSMKWQRNVDSKGSKVFWQLSCPLINKVKNFTSQENVMKSFLLAKAVEGSVIRGSCTKASGPVALSQSSTFLHFTKRLDRGCRTLYLLWLHA